MDFGRVILLEWEGFVRGVLGIVGVEFMIEKCGKMVV